MIQPAKGSALHIPVIRQTGKGQSPRLVSQSLWARSARLDRYAVPQRAPNSRWEPHNGLRTVLILAALAGGCAGNPVQSDNPTAPSSPSRPALLGTTWTAIEIDGQAIDGVESQRRPNILLSSDGNRVSGSTGCNRISGTFAQEGNTLRFGALAMTRVACVPDRSATENAFTAAMEATASHAIENQTLELRDAAGTVRMRLRPN